MRLSRKLYCTLLLQSFIICVVFILCVLFLALYMGLVGTATESAQTAVQTETAGSDAKALLAILTEADDDSTILFTVAMFVMIVLGAGGAVVSFIVGGVVISGLVERLSTMSEDLEHHSRLLGELTEGDGTVARRELADKAEFVAKMSRDMRALLAGRKTGDM